MYTKILHCKGVMYICIYEPFNDIFSIKISIQVLYYTGCFFFIPSDIQTWNESLFFVWMTSPFPLTCASTIMQSRFCTFLYIKSWYTQTFQADFSKISPIFHLFQWYLQPKKWVSIHLSLGNHTQGIVG